MWKAALAGAVALAAVSSLSITDNGVGITPAAAQEVVITEANIAQLRNALHLTPAQEGYWRTLEATLRSLTQQVRAEEAGLVQRVRARIKSYVVDAAAAHRVAAAARPLISSLDERQKSDGIAVVRAMGVASLF